LNKKPKQIKKMYEIKFNATECETLKQSVQERINGWEVIEDSIEQDGCDEYGFLYWAECENRWSGRLHNVDFEKNKDVNDFFQTVLSKGLNIIKYEEDYDKYEKLLQEKNVDIEYTHEGDPKFQGFTIHFTEESLKKLFYGNT